MAKPTQPLPFDYQDESELLTGQDDLLKQQLAQALALRSNYAQQATTPGGAALSGLADIINASKSKQQAALLRGQQQDVLGQRRTLLSHKEQLDADKLAQKQAQQMAFTQADAADMALLDGTHTPEEQQAAMAKVLRGQHQRALAATLSGDADFAKYGEALGKNANQAQQDAFERERLAQGSHSPFNGWDGAVYDFDKRTGQARRLAQGMPHGGPMGGGGSAGGGLTDDAVTAEARAYLRDHKLPSFARDNATKQRIINRTVELAKADGGGQLPDFAGNAAGYTADKASLGQMQKLVDSSEAFARTAGRNLDVFLGAAKALGDTGSPLLNVPMREAANKLAGDPKFSAFNAARQTAVAEIGKVLNSPTGAGVLSDSARHEVETLLDPNSTVAQHMAAAKVLRADMENKRAEYKHSLDEIRRRASSSAPKSEAPEASAPTTSSGGLTPDQQRRLAELRAKREAGALK